MTVKTLWLLTSNDMEIIVPSEVDVTHLKPVISISEAGSIEPASGVIQDFSSAVSYTVTSEDGNWQQTYKIIVATDISWQFDFEEWVSKSNGSYLEPAGWTSANLGAKMLNIDYPTYRSTSSHTGSYAVELRTMFGDTISSIIPPIISGSAFIGYFNTLHLMSNPLLCAEFGAPFVYDGTNKPTKLTAWIKYIPGETFTDENGAVVPNVVDEFSFYAVLFEGKDRLNIQTVNSGEKVIAKTEFTFGNCEEYTYFEIPFIYYKEIPSDARLQLSIVAGSSKEGDYYRGAVGSTLTIDDVEIIFENE